MINRIVDLSRVNRQLLVLFVDSVLLVSILLASFSIRLGYWHFPESDLIWVILGAPIITIPIFIIFGLYESVVDRRMGLGYL
jgi:FlaA1/EpsC-like NDP-sugar epimerase